MNPSSSPSPSPHRFALFLPNFLDKSVRLANFANSWCGLYGYSLIIAIVICFFSREFGWWIHADNLLTTLSAKIRLTPFLWDDSRLGYIFAYILHPLAPLLSLYDLYYCERILRTSFVAFVPVGLLMLYGKKELGYFLIPVFYLISLYCNSYSHDTVSAGGIYYYYTSFALFIATQLLAQKIQERRHTPAITILSNLVLLALCLLTYWVNVSLLLFTVPYLLYLHWQGMGGKKFIVLNILGWIPSMLLSKYVEVYGKSYTELNPDILGPLCLIKHFFFFEPYGGQVQGLIFFILSCIAAIGGIVMACRPRIPVDRRFRSFFLATLFASATFVLVASQLKYTNARFFNSNRYIMVIMLFVGFWAPLGYCEIAKVIFPFLRQDKNAKRVFTGLAALANLGLVVFLINHFALPIFQIRSDILPLEQIAHEQNARIILASDDTKYNADYWAVWAVFFKSLQENGSVKNAIIPITFRSAAIIEEINEALPGRENHDPIRALCIGAIAKVCKQTTAQSGFFHFSDYPKTIAENINLHYEEDVPVSVLEFEPFDKGTFGSMMDMVKIGSPAELTAAHVLDMPMRPDPYEVFSNEAYAMRMAPGDYQVSLDCKTEGPENGKETYGDLTIDAMDRGVVYRKIIFKNKQDFEKKTYFFNVPDYKFFVPRVRFRWTTSGKAAVKCNEFRLLPVERP